MNKYLIRNLVIYLVISGTLVSSLAVTGQVYASLNKLPDTNIGPEVGTEDEDQATDGDDEDQATDEDDNETTSEAPAASQNRFCVDGTGGSTGRACVPCDPGLKFEVGCTDVLTGGPLDTETATSESGESKSIGELKPQILGQNTAERAKIIFENLTDQGKVPPKTTEAFNSLLTGNAEQSTKALGTLCEIASKDKSSNVGKIDCSVLELPEAQPTNDTTTVASLTKVVEFLLTWAVGKILDNNPGGAVLTPDQIGAWCQNNPGKCN